MRTIVTLGLLLPFFVAIAMMAAIFFRGRPFNYRRAVVISAILFAVPVIPTFILVLLVGGDDSLLLRTVVFSAISWCAGTGVAIFVYRLMARAFNQNESIDPERDHQFG